VFGTSKPSTVLVVEDEPLILLALVDELKDHGLSVLSATSAEAALVHLERNHAEIAILFSDINLGGGMDGLSLARIVKERWNEIVLFITSGRFAGPVMPAEVRFVPKPYQYSELATDFRQVVNSPNDSGS
jgi:DNA-binding response OmpR family regulator